MMRNSYPAGGFRGSNIDGMWQAVEELRSRFGKRSGSRAGREDIAGADGAAPWDSTAPAPGTGFGALPKAGVELAQAASQVARPGKPEQVQEAGAGLDDARRRLYALLAQG